MRDVGDRIAIRYEARDPDGTLTAATVAVAVTQPDGTLLSPAPTVSSTSTGLYDAAFTVDTAGTWRWTWTVSGDLVDVAHGSVTVASSAPSTYATLPLLRKMPKIESGDRDELLMQALSSAARMIDSYTGRPPGGFDLASSATARTFGAAGRVTSDGRLLVDDIGSTTGLVVETGTTDAWTAVTDYEVGPDNAIAYGRPITSLSRPVGWPLAATERVRITARWGWPSLPEQVVQATLIQALRLYRRKDSPEGVAGAGDFGVVRLARIDPDVAALLSPFVIPGFA